MGEDTSRAPTAPTVAPDGIQTREALDQALDQLRRQAGFQSKRSLTRTAERRGLVLPKSTVDDAIGGRRIPTDQTLRAFLAVCGVDEEGVPAWLRAAARARQGDTDRPAGAVRVAAAVPRLLGVHPAIEVEGVRGETPTYVPRDVDLGPDGLHAKLAAAAKDGGFVLLIGPSSVGKSRSAYEAIRAVLPDWWLLHPDPADDLATLTSEVTGPAVVWLDELQKYLDNGALTAGTVRALLGSPHPVVLVATVWTERYRGWTVQPPAGRPDLSERHRDVVRLADVLRIPAAFSPGERHRAAQVAASDVQVRAALKVRGYGMTQALAAAPQLVDRWQDADSYAKAVLAAGVDATRLGVQSPLPPHLLRAAAPGYCTPQQQAEAQPNWFEQAIVYATEKLRGAAAALQPVGAGMGELAGYTVADFLQAYASAQLRYQRVPASTWQALLDHVDNVDEVRRLADSADNRLLYCYAEPLWRACADTGDWEATRRLSAMLKQQGRVEEAITALRAYADTSGYLLVVRYLAALLVEESRIDEAVTLLRAHADSTDWWFASRLADLLVEQGRVEEAITLLYARANVGDWWVAGRPLIDLLVEQGRVEEAITLLHPRAGTDTGGGPWVLTRLIDLLIGQGRMDEALTFLRARADTGSWDARQQLAKLLVEQGQVEELRARADTGDQHAALRLAKLLADQGQLDELRARADTGEEWAALRLIDLLVEHGRVEEAITMLRANADTGSWHAGQRLVDVLVEHGRVDEAITFRHALADASPRNLAEAWRLLSLLVEHGRVEEALIFLRGRADAGDWGADHQLVDLLVEHGRVEEALIFLRGRADAGDSGAAQRLADLLKTQGLAGELRAEVDAGRPGAAQRLIDLLVEQRRTEEATRLRRFGLNPDGSIAGDPTQEPSPPGE